MEIKQVTQPEERGWAQRLHFVCTFEDGFDLREQSFCPRMSDKE